PRSPHHHWPRCRPARPAPTPTPAARATPAAAPGRHRHTPRPARLERLVEQLMAVLAQKHEQFGPLDPPDDRLLSRRRLNRWTPHPWAHQLPRPPDRADAPSAPPLQRKLPNRDT